MFSPRQLTKIRRAIAPFLVDRLRVFDRGATVYNESTMTSNPTPGQQIYDGAGRVRPTSKNEMAVGESIMVMRDADFSFPWDSPAFERDQFIEVVESQDTQLQGRWFRITDVRLASQHATRRCSGLHIQPSRSWKVQDE